MIRFEFWPLFQGQMRIAKIKSAYNSLIRVPRGLQCRYICPLQPCRHLTLKLLIQGHPRSAKVTHIADFKSAYISLIIGPRGLQCETKL